MNLFKSLFFILYFYSVGIVDNSKSHLNFRISEIEPVPAIFRMPETKFQNMREGIAG